MRQRENTSNKGFIVAIDGPVASGKGTLSPKLAHTINGYYIYSGSIFRCIGFLCVQKKINTKDEVAVTDLIKDIRIELIEKKIVLNGEDVTQKLKDEQVAMASSDVARHKEVRDFMVRIIQDIALTKKQQNIPVIVEGRDMATTVFPDADVKIYLTADVAARARRRLEQYEEKEKGLYTFEQVLADTKKRDKQDSGRKLSPLSNHPVADGYIVIDNTDLTEEQTVQTLITELQKKKLV